MVLEVSLVEFTDLIACLFSFFYSEGGLSML